MHLEFFVPGMPAPGGSKRFVGIGKKTGRAILIDAGGQRNKDWRAAVGWKAAEVMRGREIITTACEVRMEFVVPRPKDHFRANGMVKDSAPLVPVAKPDALKLARSTEDAMTGIVWKDDAQTFSLHIVKRYAAIAEGAGCRITVNAL